MIGGGYITGGEYINYMSLAKVILPGYELYCNKADLNITEFIILLSHEFS